MKRIAIYGGSFDPPHLGHKLLAENAAKLCNADLVYIIPAASSPFKDGTQANGSHRLEMCKICFDSPLFKVSDIEIRRGGKSYTVDTVSEIKKSHPESELFLFMGDDMLLSFDKWYEYEKILAMCRIVTLCRTENRDKLSDMNVFIRNKLGGEEKAIIGKCVPIEISSTEIRRNLLAGDSSMLLPGVYEYIKSKGLYNVQK